MKLEDANLLLVTDLRPDLVSHGVGTAVCGADTVQLREKASQ